MRTGQQSKTDSKGMRRLVTEREAAEFLSTTAGSLREARHSGRLALPWVRMGRRGIRYDLQALESYVASQTVRPEGAE